MKSNLSLKTNSELQAEFENNKSAGRVSPSSLESEQALLGAILVDNDTINAALEILRAEDFYRKSHQILFQAMYIISERHEPIDIVTLTAQLRVNNQLDAAGGVEYLSHLLDRFCTAANAQYYARIIKEMSLRRRVIKEASEIVGEAFTGRGDIDRFIDEVEQRVFSISDSRVNPSFIKVGEIVKDSIKHVEFLYINKNQITGVPSGFIDLDKITSGFQSSDLVIIAGRPSMGKTALALSMAKHVALDCQKRVAIFSLEMSKEQIALRLLCSEAKVSNSKVRSGNLGESDFPKLVSAASKLAQSDMYIDDTPAISVLEMRAKARRLHKESPLSLVVVDYLQLMKGTSHSTDRRDQEISEISASLKALAKELSIPVIALSQLNRAVEARPNKRPIMADLRESGAIEQDADIIGFVYRDEVYDTETPNKGIAEVILAKHRNGAIGTVKLGFQSEFTLFVNLERDSDADTDYLGEDLSISDEDDELI